MNVNLAEKIKSLRKERGISQEKLAQYLNVSFQAISKWENGNTYPDISLLPEIARFFGITVDELLQVEVIDEERLYQEYELKTMELYRDGKVAETLPIWQEAYKKMPNNTDVKDHLMSTYFDLDKKKYQKEIIELGTELYNSASCMYFKGQAIDQIARTYAENGNMEMAQKWASKSYQLMHSQEMVYMRILKDGGELIEQFRFANHWYMECLFYMAARLSECETIPGGTELIREIDKAVAQIYEIVYPNDDMSFEALRNMCNQHRSLAEEEIGLSNNEETVRYHLQRATECAVKSVTVTEHMLTHPLVYGWQIQSAPSDKCQVVHMLKRQLDWECFAAYKDSEWFRNIVSRLDAVIV